MFAGECVLLDGRIRRRRMMLQAVDHARPHRDQMCVCRRRYFFIFKKTLVISSTRHTRQNMHQQQTRSRVRSFTWLVRMMAADAPLSPACLRVIPSTARKRLFNGKVILSLSMCAYEYSVFFFPATHFLFHFGTTQKMKYSTRRISLEFCSLARSVVGTPGSAAGSDWWLRLCPG